MRKRLIFIMVAMMAVASCGAAGDGDLVEEPPGEPVCITDTFPSVPVFVGLTADGASDLAEEQNLEVREVGRDGECFVVTDDFRQNRINLEFRGDQVVAAAVY